jgi:hypothetical protein
LQDLDRKGFFASDGHGEEGRAEEKAMFTPNQVQAQNPGAGNCPDQGQIPPTRPAPDSKEGKLNCKSGRFLAISHVPSGLRKFNFARQSDSDISRT